jgi:hypothetical protein
VRITYIVATVGRESLWRTLGSIPLHPQDEVLVVGEIPEPSLPPQMRYLFCAHGRDWGATERNFAIPYAKGEMVSFMDDDDVYAPGADAAFQSVTAPAPTIFRMQYANGHTLWKHRAAELGNIGTPMLFMPNDQRKLGWFGHRYEGDFDFWQSCLWSASEVVWREDVVALIRPDGVV